MKRKVARLRLSPNEEAQLIREEHERRRKLRIQQVREQERYIALQIRQDVQQRRERELQNLAEELKEEWERQQKEKVETLQKLYQDSLRVLGEGHRSAKENEPDWEAIAQKNEENHVRAAERYRGALKELKSQRQKEQKEQNRFIQAKSKAIQVEKERAAKVASLPPPPPNPIENIQSKKLPAVKKSDVGAFSVTHYHMPETAVDREVNTTQPNAREVAEEEAQRLQELRVEEERDRQEQLEKARLRGNHALRREQLTQDRQRLLVELEHMQQTDLLRRRQVVAQMPAQIFQPLYKRQEMREDWQRDMEFAFEDMYTGERRVKGDLVLQLVPEPLPAMSMTTGSQDEELDLTLEEVTSEEQHNDPSAQTQVEPSRPLEGAPRQALKRLLNRIRTQRDQWNTQGAHDRPSDVPLCSLAMTTDGMTIETGSLTSEETDRPLTTSPKAPSQPPQALNTTEESIVAGTLFPPDEQAKKIYAFETERTRRENQLEREKQEQIALLEELEEQKHKLELLLQDAQQEREVLQAAVHQDTAGTQEVPAQDQEVTSVTLPPVPEVLSIQPTSSVDEDDHSKRIREFQQRLLEQNRLHEQSVEQARRRLEEYQHALRSHYPGMNTAVGLPTGTRGPVHPLPSGAEVVMPLASPLEPATGPVVPLYRGLPVSLNINAQSPTPLVIPTHESSILAQTPFLHCSGLRTRFSQQIDSTNSPMQREPAAESSRDQRPDATALLVEDMTLKRVLEHPSERLRPPSTLDPLPYRLLPTHRPCPHIPHPSSTDHIQNIRLTQSEVGPGPLSYGEEVERQQWELRESQRRVQGRREALLQEQREQRRRQKEALQALVTPLPDPEAADCIPGSEDMGLGPDRLKLMSTLLRAIEESNGHTSSSVEANQSLSNTFHLQPVSNDPASQNELLSRPAPHPPSNTQIPRAPKPPVARARLGVLDTMMMEQHELSAIQEVETPINNSLVTAPEECVRVSHTEGRETEEQEHSVRGQSSISMSSTGEHSAGTGTGTGSGTGTGRSRKLSWRERLRLEAGASPERDPAPALPDHSQHSSHSGRGIPGCHGPATTTFKSPTELESLSLQSAHRPSEPDCLSSTTISSGSYATTDPDHNSTEIDTSLVFAGFGPGGGALLNGSSSSRHRSYRNMSDPASPTQESLLHNSSIQSIIDKYTRELNVSLSMAGNPTVREVSVLEELGSSVSQHPWSKVLENRGRDSSQVWGADPHSLPSHTESGAQRHDQEWDNTINRIIVRLSDQSSLGLDQGRDSSISLMVGQLSDQSSCLGMNMGRDSAGRRTAQSSSLDGDLEMDSTLNRMIGQLSDQSTSMGVDQGWDLTLSRMIGRLLNQSSSSQFLGRGRESSASQLIGQIGLDQSSLWLVDGQDEMRPLVGEFDESAAHQSGSSAGGDGANSSTWVDLGGSTQTGVSSGTEGAPEAQSLSSSPPGLDPHCQTLQHSGSSLEPDRTVGMDPASDSFQPLLAEVTHNETAEPSMTFHLPEEEDEELGSPNGGDHVPVGELNLSPCSEEPPRGDLEEHTDPFVNSDPSPERLRTEEPSQSQSALQDSLYQLTTSQCLPHDWNLVVSPVAEEVRLAAHNLSGLSLQDVPTLDLPPEAGDADIESTPQTVHKEHGCGLTIEDLGQQESNVQLPSHSNANLPLWEQIMEMGSEKGILEESHLTLDHLTDTTLQDQELRLTEEEGGESLDELEKEDTEKDEVVEKELEYTLLPEEDTNLKQKPTPAYAVMLLEFQSSPSVPLQDAFQLKRRALLHRSAHRVEEIKAKRAETKSDTRIHSTTMAKREGKSTELGHAAGDSKQRKPKLQPAFPVSKAKLKKVGEVRISTPEDRKLDVAAMHQRTERLYNQLEEVKHLKEIRSRQESYVKNREKAKEFHKKTLQKLRAKQIPR